MSERFVPSDDLRRAALEFAKANQEALAILKRLELASKKLEKKWTGSTQEMFLRHYESCRSQFENAATHMDLIAKELEAIVDRFEEVDG
ncbi:MAG: WXG100 family type VII secretion target [Candidatus Thorarchaeota archaeon]